MARAPSGYDLLAQAGDCLMVAYLNQMRGAQDLEVDRALADKLWNSSSNMLTVLVSGLEGLGDLLAVASFGDDGSEPGTEIVGKVGWLVGEVARLIEGAMAVQDRAGVLKNPFTPEEPSPPAGG